MSPKKSLQRTVQQKAQETVMKLMADERTRPMVAKAMQTYMESRQRVDQVRDQTAQNLGLATQADVQAVRGRLRKLEKKLDQLTTSLERLESSLSA